MIFGEMPLNESAGAILAHAVKHRDGMFKKGRVLTRDDIVLLEAAGVARVFAARLEPGDVPEDEAAAAVAAVLGGEGTLAQAPFTGRANLYASCRGLALVDAARVTALNRLDESLTLATVPPFASVDGREMVATVKVIPFAVPRRVLDDALAIIAERPLVQVRSFREKRVGLIITRLPQTKPALLLKSEEAMRERVSSLGGALSAVAVVAHDIASVAEAIAGQLAAGAQLVLVFGASAIVDRGDVIPMALHRAGGQVVHLGMPVDPGNLMMFGALGPVPVIGVPSCARSPKLNGFDWVLARVMADVPVSALDIMDMGAGGLLAEIPTRPAPREGKARVQRAPRVAAVVLAAGQSSRMGENKLLAELGGQPMIRRTVAAIRQAVDLAVVVTGRDAGMIGHALEGLPVRLVHNSEFAQGLSTSLRAGVAALPPDTDAVLIALGDMPLVDAQTVRRLIAAYNPAEHRSICVPVFGGRRGNPVLWGRQHFEALQSMSGDAGARSLLDALADESVEVGMPDDAVLTDVDTPEALARLRSAHSTGN